MPIGIRYRYVKPSWRISWTAVESVEADSGFACAANRSVYYLDQKRFISATLFGR